MKMTATVVTAGACVCLLALTSCSSVQAPEGPDAYFKAWPAGKSPLEIGQRVAQHFIDSPHSNFGRPTPPPNITYPEVCAWYGALTFAEASGVPHMKGQLIRRFEPLFNTETNLVPRPDHVDHTVFAAVPLEIYILNADPRCLALGKQFADAQWGEPFGKSAPRDAQANRLRGLSWQTRMWIDDMFMITMVQAQAYRATGNHEYINRAAKEMVAYLDALQQPNGLFFHAPDVPYYWGRGDGWMAAGMSELLRSLPQDNPDRPRILDGYRKMMAALLKYQDANGMWHELIDDPDAWPETSSTGMFAFAFITGVKEGWLDGHSYGPAARKAWLGLTSYLDKNYDLRDVCEGTGKYNSKTDGANGRAYYLARRRITGDMHGQAPVLWCATALLR
ncbi:MAG TPA: glycoside hydrolase family 88 protein [Verrucomicrobiae bacterium]|jgi:rhamnogalacturonyl hydrolase YesR|nr:glycoside hydrolase family 88 protein [Verrucomicrobiae bacterium]